MTPEDKKLWEEVAKTIKPLQKKNKEVFRKVPQEPPVSSEENSLERKEIKKKESQPTSLLRPRIMVTQDRLITRKLRQGQYRIEATLDLHGQTQNEAYTSLIHFLQRCRDRQFKLVLIITGKGVRSNDFTKREPGDAPMGILRQKVPEWLENSDSFSGIISVSVARPQDGGTGAWYVELKS